MHGKVFPCIGLPLLQLGYREGALQGTNNHTQEGFNNGFKDGIKSSLQRGQEKGKERYNPVSIYTNDTLSI